MAFRRGQVQRILPQMIVAFFRIASEHVYNNIYNITSNKL